MFNQQKSFCELVAIGRELRLTFFAIECVFDVVLDSRECERVFQDAAEDQVSAKEYLFFESSVLSIRGKVDEYEPETIWLTVEGKRAQDVLSRVIETAKHHAKRFTSEN
jgi:hypothetical protein